MDFLKACAARLDAGETAEAVLADMRVRYTTVRCLNVKTCLVRQLCAPTAEWTAARDALLASQPDDVASRVDAVLARRGGPDPDALQLVRDAALPHKYATNVYSLRITRGEGREVKRSAARSAVAKNRTARTVDGAALLARARAWVAHPPDHVLDLALALLLVTGRRTCELLNGHSHFVVVDTHAIAFAGQAKKRGASASHYTIPTLAPAAEVVAAVDVLRCRQGHVQLTNKATSVRYQSALRQRLLQTDLMRDAGRVHNLRGVYACMILRLFDWEEHSDAFVAMCVLGQVGLYESLVYTPFRLGATFGTAVPQLGVGHLTPPPEPTTA